MGAHSPIGNFINIIADAGLAYLIGKPSLSDYPPRPISPVSKLLFSFFCSSDLLLFLVGAIGGVGIWTYAQWAGQDDPLKNSPALSLVFEGWCFVGFTLGFVILFMSRYWVVSSGVVWGRMGIRLALIVFATLFALHLVGFLEQDVNVSLATGVMLLLASKFFLQYGWDTLRDVMSLPYEGVQPIQGKNLIFISYRREDSKEWTDRIGDKLKGQFGEKVVFQDVGSIPPGVDFRRYIDDQLKTCKVFLAMIGPGWLRSEDEQGHRRIDQTQDLLRLEIETALKQNILVVPLLVGGATMPAEKDLPSSLKDLAFRNSLRIRGNPDFRNDMNRLISHLGKFLRS